MAAEDAAVGEVERLHPFFLLTGLGGSLRGMAGGYAFIGYLAVSGRLEFALLAAAALIAMLAVGLFLYWRRFEYRVGANEIRIDSGIVSRTHRSIPFDRIQDVEISQGPIARLLGLAKVKFETGGSAGAGQDEGSLQAIALDRAEAIRTLVRSRRHAAVDATAGAAEDERPPVFAMDQRRVLLAGLFNFSLAVFAGLFGLTQTVGDLVGFDPLDDEFWEQLISRGDPVAEFLLQHQIAVSVAGVALLLLVGVLTGVTRTVLRDFGFRLDRTGVGLRRRRGLLTKSDVTLPASRAQAAIVASGPIREAFGWRELKLQSLAKDEGGKGDHVLAPLASAEEVGTILHEFGWRAVSQEVDWRPVSRAYVWTLVLGLTPLYLLCLAQAAAILFVWARVPSETLDAIAVELTPLFATFLLTLGGTLLAIGLRYLAWRRMAYALDGDRLLIRSGWWRRRMLVLPVRRIQSIDLAQSFIGRWFKTVSLAFGVAGGSGLSVHQIPALNEEKARELRNQLLSPLL